MSEECHKPPSPAMWRALALWLLGWVIRSHLICTATKKPTAWGDCVGMIAGRQQETDHREPFSLV